AGLVRAGAEKLVVEGAFDTDDAAVREALAQAGLADGDSDGGLVIRREVAGGGKGRLFVNGSPAALKTLADVAPRLLVLYGQAEARELLDPAAPRELLDRYAGLSEEARRTAGLHREWRSRETDLERLRSAAEGRARRLELLDFQIREIDAVKPEEGEDVALSSEKGRLSNVEKVGNLLAAVSAALESDESGAIPAAAAARRALQSLEEVDAAYAARVAEVSEAIETLREVAFETAGDLSRLEADPGRLAFVAERLDALAKLKRKYGATLGDVVRFREEIGREREELSDLEGSVAKAEKASREAFEAYRKAALELSAARAAAAPRLGKAVRAHLTELAFPKAAFDVSVARKADAESPFAAGGERVAFAAHGIDVVAFTFSPNPGEPARPLPKIASGGELARVQLALAASLAEEEMRLGGGRPRRGGPVRTFVFDEVDAGVSGATAEAVGRKLRSLARREQVLVVTHLPQVAAAGERHLLVEKETSGGRTRTRVAVLDERGRVEAIAGMLAGASVGPSARAQAKQLLSSY
ncbi:MAG TPA: DNA repair protein RecN, partial [Thermoanaerobaculia bacterium]|nr:DNA repair protein RecN [Thermoanaerobaculia bacterium]